MAHLSIRIPDADLAWLKAEAARQDKDVSTVLRELIHRAYDVTTSPLTASAGELAKRVDREGLLRVLVLGARKGQLLVEPDGAGFDNILLWVDADLVTFPETKDQILAMPQPPVSESSWQSLRLNMMTAPPKKFDPPGDLLRTNLKISDEPEARPQPTGSAPVPSICGVCKQPFPSKAAKRRHYKDAHSASSPDGPVSNS
jgi:hypothetical protein